MGRRLTAHALAPLAFEHTLVSGCHLLPAGDLGHADLPERSAGCPGCGAVSIAITVVRSVDAGPLERRLELGDRRSRPRSAAAHRRGVGDEVDLDPLRRRSSTSMLLNDGAALADLQAVDDGEAAVVAERHDQLVAGQHRPVRSEFIIRYEPSPTNTITSPSGRAILRPPGARDLVAHAREAVLAVEGRRRPSTSQLTFSSPGKPAGRGERVVVRRRRAG